MSIHYKCDININDLLKNFKNKSDHSENTKKINKIEDALQCIRDDFNKLTKDIDERSKSFEDYKKITNERIEKIFKLVMMNSGDKVNEILKT